MASRIGLLGAGGFGLSLAWMLKEEGWNPVLFDDGDLSGLSLPEGMELGGPMRAAAGLPCLITIGNPAVRAKLAELDGVNWSPAFIHPAAKVMPGSQIGRAALVLPGAVVMPGARIGLHAIIGPGAVVDHDAEVGAFSLVNAGAIVASGAQIGRACRLDPGAVAAMRSVLPDGAALVHLQDVSKG